MRKLIKNKRGDISAPIITILLVIASISIAALVISWLYGLGISTSKQANIIVVGTPTLQVQGSNVVLYITLKNVGNLQANITGIYIQTITGSTTSTASSNNCSVSFVTTTTNAGTTTTTTTTKQCSSINPGETQTITATFNNVSIGSLTQVNGVIQTTAGTIPFIAVVQR
ncbi:MAG TPA: hypothetical protein VKU94_00955 [Geobacterales bacterium]|nr:hypothetical protein [Geobacterales bacterium]